MLAQILCAHSEQILTACRAGSCTPRGRKDTQCSPVLPPRPRVHPSHLIRRWADPLHPFRDVQMQTPGVCFTRNDSFRKCVLILGSLQMKSIENCPLSVSAELLLCLCWTASREVVRAGRPPDWGWHFVRCLLERVQSQRINPCVGPFTQVRANWACKSIPRKGKSKWKIVYNFYSLYQIHTLYTKALVKFE